MSASEVKTLVLLFKPSITNDARLDSLIDEAILLTSEDVYGDQDNLAAALMLLHWYELFTRAGSTGPVTMEKVGDIVRQYGYNSTASGAVGYFESTSWGMQLLNLDKRKIVRVFNKVTGL